MLLDIQQRGEVMNLRSTVRLGALHSRSYPTLTQPVGAKASLLQRAVLPLAKLSIVQSGLPAHHTHGRQVSRQRLSIASRSPQ